MGEERLIRREFPASDWTPGPTQPQAGSAEFDPDTLSPLLAPALFVELRTDHAGESGEVMVSRGILAMARDPVFQAFASEQLATESRRFACIEQTIPALPRSVLFPLWRVAGWLTGTWAAMVGTQAAVATIQTVETFFNRHCAAFRWTGRAGTLRGTWLPCVSAGSEAAVRISRKL